MGNRKIEAWLKSELFEVGVISHCSYGFDVVLCANPVFRSP